MTMTLHRPQITRELLSQKQKMGTLHYVIWFVVSKMCISKNKKNVENIKMKQETHVYEWIAGAHFKRHTQK